MFVDCRGRLLQMRIILLKHSLEKFPWRFFSVDDNDSIRWFLADTVSKNPKLFQ